MCGYDEAAPKYTPDEEPEPGDALLPAACATPYGVVLGPTWPALEPPPPLLVCKRSSRPASTVALRGWAGAGRLPASFKRRQRRGQSDVLLSLVSDCAAEEPAEAKAKKGEGRRAGLTSEQAAAVLDKVGAEGGKAGASVPADCGGNNHHAAHSEPSEEHSSDAHDLLAYDEQRR